MLWKICSGIVALADESRGSELSDSELLDFALTKLREALNDYQKIDQELPDVFLGHKFVVKEPTWIKPGTQQSYDYFREQMARLKPDTVLRVKEISGRSRGHLEVELEDAVEGLEEGWVFEDHLEEL